MLLDGKKLRDEKIELLQEKIDILDVKPTLVVVQVGDDPASKVYVGQKEKLALKLGFNFIHKKYDADVSEEYLIEEIKKMNEDSNINGIIVQLPISKHLDEHNIINNIDPSKDVDGLTDINAGRLFHGSESFIPCTPKGIMSLLENNGISVSGKRVSVVGRSILVGRPMQALLLNNDATVTMCHSKTVNLSSVLKESDIVIVAIGKPNFITADMVKDDVVIVDVGINRVDGKLVGDVDFNDVVNKASFITPVPGGVGPMTVISLMENTYLAYLKENENKKILKKEL